MALLAKEFTASSLQKCGDNYYTHFIPESKDKLETTQPDLVGQSLPLLCLDSIHGLTQTSFGTISETELQKEQQSMFII